MVDGESEEEAEVDCTWDDEEDYTLAHAWRRGLDPTTCTRDDFWAFNSGHPPFNSIESPSRDHPHRRL